MAWVVEFLPSKHKTLEFRPQYLQKKEKKECLRVRADDSYMSEHP
jgi:hypothetical protein